MKFDKLKPNLQELNLNGSEFQNMFQKECESLWAGAVSPEEFAQRVDEQAAPILSK